MDRDLFAQTERVRQLLGTRPRGMVVDVDGTISEIAPSPDSASVSSSFKQHLRTLLRQLDVVAAISGRSTLDVRSLVGVEGLVYVGNHGLEWWLDGRAQLWPGAEPYVDKISSALGEIRGRLSVQGAIVENKGVTAAIHYREAEEAGSARAAILAAIDHSPSARGLRVTEGKMVVELRPPLRLHKGRALARLVRKHGLRSVIYLGDDVTDVDAFVVLRKLRMAGGVDGLAVAVLGPETPRKVLDNADATLQGVSEVERFLQWLTGELAK